jgi:uncharacterized membrane protein
VIDEAASSRRLAGVDLARALAMLGMLVEHTIQYPTLEPKGVLWSVYGRSAPLFVLLAGLGLTLGTNARRPLSRAMVVARAPFLLLVGMTLSLWVDGIILQSFALFFVVGVCFVRVPRWVLGALSAACLVAGPLYLTVLRRAGDMTAFGDRSDVGFDGLAHPATLVRGLVLEFYPAVIWLGFFFAGMLLGRFDLRSSVVSRRLFAGATVATALVFTIGWAGSKAFGPEPFPFSLAPASPTTWAEHWTTYGFSNAVGWAVSATCLSLTVVGGSLVLVEVAGAWRRLLAPVVALGSMSLSFYCLHFAYLDTGWEALKPHLTTTATYFLASVAFWLAFAVVAQQWFRFLPRGPIELVVHAGALAVTWPLRLAGARSARRAEGEPGRPVDVVDDAHRGDGVRGRREVGGFAP